MKIEFAAASVTYEGRTVLEPLTLTLDERRIGVVGLNGSGKTTFARLINGLVKPTTGTVRVDGLDTVADEAAARGRTGFVFQNPQHQIILPVLGDDIAFGLKNRGLAKDEIAERTERVLERLSVSHLARRRVHELSGGETQLGAIASVLVTGPDLVILDEPTNQLDLCNRAMIEATIAGLSEQAIVISHDLPLIERFERVLLFHQGRLAADGAADAVLRTYREIAAC